MKPSDILKCALVFVNGFAAVVAAHPGTDLDTMTRLFCAALVAGCGATLLFLDRIGGQPSRLPDVKRMTPAQRRRLATELRAEMEQRVVTVPAPAPPSSMTRSG